jgi:hypothetical protein
MKHTWNIKMDASGSVVSTTEIPVQALPDRTIQVTEDTLSKAIRIAETMWAAGVAR